MCHELFGPILTLHVFDETKWEDMLDVVDRTSPYAPTVAVVGQQSFGGARMSGTNDKAGSSLNLLRWISPRTIMETFVPATDDRYPYMG